MTSAPGLFQRLIVLKDSFDRRRLRMGWDLLRQKGPRVLLTQLMVHTAFRWRLRRLGVSGIATDLVSPVDEPDEPPELYREGIWPEEVPLISVVIPCFNYGAFVAEAVDSVLAQTFQDLEIIVVEGGSTDTSTRQVVAALHRPKTITLFRDEPCPVGDNRNFGIGKARGKYICCLDADDVLQPTYLEKALFLLDVCGGDVVSTSVQQFGAASGGYGVLPNPDLSDMLQGNQVATCAVFRRSLWEQAGGFKDTGPEMPYIYEDWRLWVRFAALGARILNISGERLLLYRAHDRSSLSNRPDLLPIQQQAPLVRQLNEDVITSAAFEKSRIRAARRLKSLDGPRNLTRRAEDDVTAPTILLAVPFLTLGGAERLLSQVVSGLRKSGFRIVIVSTIHTWPELGDTTSWFEPSTSEIYHLPRFLPRSRWLEFVEYLVCAKRVSAVLLAGSLYFYDIIPELKTRHPEIRIVDLLFNNVAHTDSNRRIAAALDFTLVEGEEVRSWLLAKGERPERIRLIPSGIDMREFRPAIKSSRILQDLGFPTDAFIVGFSGRLAEEKAPLSFLKIAASMPAETRIRFVMTGAGPLEEKVRAALRNGRLGERLHFPGMVADVRAYLGCYDVLVLPSILDGRPTVVMEALAMGIPVVASAVGSLADLVIHGETGFLCKPNGLGAFATHIQWLYDHPEEHARMRVAAREFAEKHFNLERMISGYVSIFETMASDSKA